MLNVQNICPDETNKARSISSKPRVFQSGKRDSSPGPSLRQVAVAFFGSFIAISILALATSTTHLPLVLGSFGASCCIVFGYPDTPFARPRNVIGGHFIATLTGLVFLYLFGAHWWSLGLALATSIALMLVTRTAHPPAASNPVIVMLSAPAWSFLYAPTLIGAGTLVLVGVLYNNLVKSAGRLRSI